MHHAPNRHTKKDLLLPVRNVFVWDLSLKKRNGHEIWDKQTQNNFSSIKKRQSII